MKLHQYLRSKMQQCAPNLAALIGEQVSIFAYVASRSCERFEVRKFHCSFSHLKLSLVSLAPPSKQFCLNATVSVTDFTTVFYYGIAQNEPGYEVGPRKLCKTFVAMKTLCKPKSSGARAACALGGFSFK